MTSNLIQYSVVVPAAGIGSRMRSELPKQYLKIAGKAVIEHTLERLLSHPQIKRVVVALNPEDQYFHSLPIANSPDIDAVIGGAERSASVLSGLIHLPSSEEWVLVHDAARPCLHQEDLTALLTLAEGQSNGGILATKVRDTMKRSDTRNTIISTEPRENLWHALTPQFFKLQKLKSALKVAEEAGAKITDEASAMEFIGEKVGLVEGKASNIKITQPDDLLLAEFYLTQV